MIEPVWAVLGGDIEMRTCGKKVVKALLHFNVFWWKMDASLFCYCLYAFR